jgi:hypothetical protein
VPSSVRKVVSEEMLTWHEDTRFVPAEHTIYCRPRGSGSSSPTARAPAASSRGKSLSRCPSSARSSSSTWLRS